MTSITDMANFINVFGKDQAILLKKLIHSNCDEPPQTDKITPLEDLIISAINTRIIKNHTRNSGLIIIRYILPRISEENLFKFGIHWITQAAQSLDCTDCNVSEITIACHTLADLVISCKNISELHKQISMQNVKQLVNFLSNIKSENKCGAVYYLLAVLLHHYPEVCERFQDSLKNMILNQIDSNEQNLVAANANCYTLLTKITENSFKRLPHVMNYTNWVYNQLLLCNSLHVTMNQLFENVLEFISDDRYKLEDFKCLDLPKISESNILEYYETLERRFINLNIYLATILRGCRGWNSVSPTNIFRVLCRGLSIMPLSLTNQKSLYLILPRLHVSLLETLNALIEGFKQELMPFGSSFFKLIHETLEGTEKVLNNHTLLCQHESYKYVRLFTYKTINVWLTYTGPLSGVETMTKYFLPYILKDINSLKNSVLLTVQKNDHISKNSTRKLNQNKNENNSASYCQEAYHPHLNVDICEEAHMILQNILFSGNCWLNVSFYEMVKNEVIESLQHLYFEALDANIYKKHVKCRLQLLKTLKALQVNCHPLTSPPTQFSVEIFNMALTDANIHVRLEAQLGLAELEKTIHPSAPSLNFPIECSDMEASHNE